MKKFIVFVFILSLVLSFAGCNGIKPNTDDTTPNAATINEFSSDDAVALLKEQLIIAFEKTYGEFVPSDEEPATYTDDKERLSYIIPRLTVKEETEQYYIIPVIWDFYIDKETQEIFKYYDGLDKMFIPFDPQIDTALSFAG